MTTADPNAPADAGAAAAPKPAEEGAGATRTIARNSFWLLLDTGYGMVASFTSSIAVARGLGPDLMGLFNYILAFVSVLRNVTELAIPMTFRKFASELMGKQDYAALKTLIRVTARAQLVLAALGVTAGMLIAFFFTTAERQVYLALAVASIVPAMLMSLPSGALQATENVRYNVVGSLVAITLNLIGITLSVLLHWALVGVLASLLISRTVDCVLRFILYRRVYSKIQFPEGNAPLDPALRKRLLHFASRQLVQIAFQILLWERMEVFLIKWKATTRDVAFFSVSVTFVQYVMQLPAVLSQAAGVTLMVQQGRRGPNDVARLGITAVWFCLLLGGPPLFGVASLAGPLFKLIYGAKYLPAIPVLMTLTLFGMAQVAQFPLGSLLLATEQQNFIILWGSVQVVVNVVGCLLLIPHLGPVGAAIARGLCHVVGAVGFLTFIARKFHAPMPVFRVAKLIGTCAVMFFAVRAVGRPLSSLPAILVGIPVGIVVFSLGMRWTRCLDEADRKRLVHLGRMLPGRIRGGFMALLDFLTRTPRVAPPMGA